MSTPLDRALFSLDPEVLWIMHCAEAPVPKPAVEASRSFLEKELRPWKLSPQDWLEPLQQARSVAARLLGAEASDVTLTAGTSAGLTTLAQSFPWQAGDEVVAPLGEFPSNVWPWKALAARGVGFREVALWDGHRSGADALLSAPPTVDSRPEARLLEALGPRTRVLTVSWVRFQDGLRLDLQKLARGCAERGVWLVVDGIQGAGTLPVDLSGVAAFATGVHKGLMAPQGLGLLWTSPELRERLNPMGSWLSVEAGAGFSDLNRKWVTDGRKLEHSTPNSLSLSALAVSLQLLCDAGPARIAEHVSALQAALLERLSRSGAWGAELERLRELRERARIGSILALHHQGRGAESLQALLQAGFERGVYASVREGYLRIALHGWHGEEDVGRVAEWLMAGPAGR